MKKRKNKLPRFWLGTRVPTDMGYQRNNGIGATSFTTTPGESIAPEVKAMRQNLIPNAIQTLSSNAKYPMMALENWKPIATSTAGNTAQTGAQTATQTAASVGAETGSQVGAEASASTGAASAGGKALNAVGKAASIAGTALGLYNMYNDISNMNSHRSAGDMTRMLSTTNVTTDRGTQYVQRGGINAGAEMAYANASRQAKQTNFFLNQLGLGASIGSFWGPVGTAIGGAAGAVVGGLGSLFGFGDTTEETKNALKLAGDVVAMENRQNKSVGESTDVKQEFLERASAANGKLPGRKLGKGVARLSGGETVQLGSLKVEVPGEKNNKDEYIARKGTLLGEMVDDPRSIVWTNKGGISDFIKNGGDEQIALEAMKNIQKNYKNGKLPKYVLGTPGEYIMALAPHLGQFATAMTQYNRDKNAPLYVPRLQADYSGAINSAYRMMGDQIDKRPYFNLLNNQTKQALWRARRNPGIGMGGRMTLENSLNRQLLDQYAKTSLDIDLQNQAQRNKAESALQTLLGHSTDVNNQNMGAWLAMTQQANAAKENALRQDLYNLTMPGINAATDYLKILNTNKASEYNDKRLGIWERTADAQIKALLNGLGDNQDTERGSSSTPTLQYTPKQYGYSYSYPSLSSIPDYYRVPGLGYVQKYIPTNYRLTPNLYR